LVGALARAEGSAAQDFLARAGGLGVDLEGELVMIVIGPPVSVERMPPDTEQGSRELRRALRASRRPAVVGFVDGNLTAVLSSRGDADLGRLAESVLGHLDGGTYAGSHVGVSRPCTVSQLPQAQSEAGAAHRLGPSSGRAASTSTTTSFLYRHALAARQAARPSPTSSSPS